MHTHLEYTALYREYMAERSVGRLEILAQAVEDDVARDVPGPGVSQSSFLLRFLDDLSPAEIRTMSHVDKLARIRQALGDERTALNAGHLRHIAHWRPLVQIQPAHLDAKQVD